MKKTNKQLSDIFFINRLYKLGGRVGKKLVESYKLNKIEFVVNGLLMGYSSTAAKEVMENEDHEEFTYLNERRFLENKWSWLRVRQFLKYEYTISFDLIYLFVFACVFYGFIGFIYFISLFSILLIFVCLSGGGYELYLYIFIYAFIFDWLIRKNYKIKPVQGSWGYWSGQKSYQSRFIINSTETFNFSQFLHKREWLFYSLKNESHFFYKVIKLKEKINEEALLFELSFRDKPYYIWDYYLGRPFLYGRMLQVSRRRSILSFILDIDRTLNLKLK